MREIRCIYGGTGEVSGTASSSLTPPHCSSKKPSLGCIQLPQVPEYFDSFSYNPALEIILDSSRNKIQPMQSGRPIVALGLLSSWLTNFHAIAFAPPIAVSSSFLGQKIEPMSRFTTTTSTGAAPLEAEKAGSFFNPVGSDNDDDNEKEDGNNDSTTNEQILSNLLRQRQPSSPRNQPQNRKPTQGFAAQRIQPPSDSGKPFVGIGPPLNDVTAPEYDAQGYTLYADERTGKKSRVFEALVDYPCDFTLKIVGANEGSFVSEMVALVAESCQVSVSALDGKWSSRLNGKWTSLTVKAPVQSADMLYALYEQVDRDPRVKFKF